MYTVGPLITFAIGSSLFLATVMVAPAQGQPSRPFVRQSLNEFVKDPAKLDPRCVRYEATQQRTQGLS